MEKKVNNFNGKISKIQINIASPEQIRNWSSGEITESETINYKTLKPEKNGLFNEVVFGPVKDYECSCGKYKKVKHRGIKCEKCSVEITESIVRRERMGHIELEAPVAHIWMTKELPSPSKISLLLDISYKQVDQIVYFVNYIVIDEGIYSNDAENKIFSKKDILDLSAEKSKKSRGNLRKTLRLIMEMIEAKKTFNEKDYDKARAYYDHLKYSTLPFSIADVFDLIQKYTGIKFAIGAEAIKILLKELDLKKENDTLRKILESYKSLDDPKAKKILRRLEVIKNFMDSKNKPEWMVLDVIPVTPPDTRPIIQLDGGKFTTSNINNFYRKIIIRNDRLKKMKEAKAPSTLINNEKRMLQEAVDALFDNSSKKKPQLSKDKKPLKSLSNYLKGKQGLFRQNLLGKRVDYSGRSVIVVGPELKMYEVGIPTIMILKLFKPFIIHELIKRRENDSLINQTPIAKNIRDAEQLIAKQDDVIWDIVKKVIKSRPVILNRAPTLHRLGIQAFEPRMIEGKAIRLHPLVTPAFNADFDGDQMAVHVPLGQKAIDEARDILLAPWHILGPKDGKPIVTPTQDMILGNYYLTIENKDKVGSGLIFNDLNEIQRALLNKKVHTHSVIGFRSEFLKDKNIKTRGLLITTPGKLILNDIFPSTFDFINNADVSVLNTDEDILKPGTNIKDFIANRENKNAFDKKTFSKLIYKLYLELDKRDIPPILDKIKSLGFEYSTKSAISISLFDIPKYEDTKEAYFKDANREVAKLKKQYHKGLLTEDERYKKVIEKWTDIKKIVTTDIENLVASDKYKDNSIIIMSQSGARGNISNFTQLVGMRGLMSKSYNYDQKQKTSIIRDTIEIPIKHSFMEGLSISEFFNSSYGARKGMTDTAIKTSKAGYMTRKLVDAAQEVIINNIDCSTNSGLVVRKIINDVDNSVIESLHDRIFNRFSFSDIIDPVTNEKIILAGKIIDESTAQKIQDSSIEEVVVRSPLHCQNKHGVCQKCFGIDLSTNKLVQTGTAIGIIAAQSIGEPGTQLTMRTFHTGGVAGGSNITQGFERLKQLFDCIPPKEWEKSIISEISGKVIEVILNEEENYKTVIVENDIERREYIVNSKQKIRIKNDDVLKCGDKITEGSIDLQELLLIAGVNAVREYMIREVQIIYRLQGINISDKYIEVIIRQLTSKLKIVNPGDSKYFIGSPININTLKNQNTMLLNKNKKPIFAVYQIFGLEDVPGKSDSFLSAASFQDTKKILTSAAVKGQVDELIGIKENVILGHLVPIGTGLEVIDESPDAVKHKAYLFDY